MSIGEHDKEQFREEGYFLLPHAIPDERVEELRAVCEHYIAEFDSSVPAEAAEDEAIHDGELQTRVTPQGRRFLANTLTEKGNRYFLQQRHSENAVLRDFISSALMAEICMATIGDDAYFHFEGYVVKGGDSGTGFSWHQDGGYVPTHRLPYVTAWCALDAVDEDNGTLYVLPYSRAGGRELADHVRLPGAHDKVGYFGDDPGVPVILPAGGVVVLSSLLFHSSGPNNSRHARRALVVQYSAEPILTEDGTSPWHSADPFLRNGRRVGR